MPVRSSLLLTLLALASCKGKETGPVVGDTAQPIDAPVISARPGVVQNIVVLVVDGARIEETFGDESNYGEGWSEAAESPTADILPRIQTQLLPAGGLVRPGYVVGETNTQQAHSDFLTGFREPVGPITLNQGVGPFRLDHPTLFELARQQWDLDEDQVVLTSNTIQMVTLAHSLHPAYGEDYRATNVFWDEEDVARESETMWETEDNWNNPGRDDGVVIDDVKAWLEGGARLVVANLHQVDRTGHEHPTAYDNYVSRVDNPIYQLWRWIQSTDSGLRNKTLLVVFSDHGRHRNVEYDYSWRHHGCGCTGCREVPMLLLGPGIDPGAEAEERQVLEDLSQTAAWLAGLDMPYGTGMVMEDLFTSGPDVTQPTGPRALASSGDLLAWQEPRGGFARRSQIVVDGTLFDDDHAFMMEAPNLLSTKQGTVACWRRLSLGANESYWQWKAECYRQGEQGWTSMNFPDIPVGPHFHASLAQDQQGRILAAYVDWMAGTEENDKPHAVYTRTRLFRFTDEGGWARTDQEAPGTLPLAPSLLWHDDRAYVAHVESEPRDRARYTRHVEVCPVRWPEGEGPTWQRCAEIPLSDSLEREYERHDDPALGVWESTPRAGFLGWRDGGIHLLTSELNGTAWTTPQAVDSEGRVLPQVAPDWSDNGYLYWAHLDDVDAVELCRLRAGETKSSCQATDRAHADSLAAVSTGAWISVSDGDGQWEAVLVEWD